MLKHGDADILSMLDGKVPPIDLGNISIFRLSVSKFEKKAGVAF